MRRRSTHQHQLLGRHCSRGGLVEPALVAAGLVATRSLPAWAADPRWEEQPEQVQELRYGQLQPGEGNLSELLAASDGSGGRQRARWLRLRRAGAGWAVFSKAGELLSAACGRPPGKQSVSRAELWAAAKVVEKTKEVPVLLAVDASYVVGGAKKLLQQSPKAIAGRRNGDLWLQLRRALLDRTASIRIEKIKSHPTIAQVARQAELPGHAWGANAFVDVLADHAANHDGEKEGRVNEWLGERFKLAWSVVRRAVAIVRSRPEAPEEAPGGGEGSEAGQKALGRTSPVQLLARTRHKPTAVATGRFLCRACRAASPAACGATAANIRLRAWQQQPCRPTAASLHDSHQLRVGPGGTVGCGVCGKWGRQRFRALRSACEGLPRTAASRLAAVRIRRGLDPERGLGQAYELEVVVG